MVMTEVLPTFFCHPRDKSGEKNICTIFNLSPPQLAPEEVLGTPEGVAIFAKWAPATGLFHRRYRALGTLDEGEEDDTQE